MRIHISAIKLNSVPSLEPASRMIDSAVDGFTKPHNSSTSLAVIKPIHHVKQAKTFILLPRYSYGRIYHHDRYRKDQNSFAALHVMPPLTRMRHTSIN
jgi:hypothetical protein